jgi:hypothetical protein
MFGMPLLHRLQRALTEERTWRDSLRIPPGFRPIDSLGINGVNSGSIWQLPTNKEALHADAQSGMVKNLLTIPT